MSVFASLIAATRLNSDNIEHIVSQAVKGEYWLCLSLCLFNGIIDFNATVVFFSVHIVLFILCYRNVYVIAHPQHSVGVVSYIF